ncbi:MAG: hypothetical protein QOJ03_1201 [Frankiaceae bacterium]|nr:hypothetical protein [Frankiaceae bacterium]
MTLPRAVGVVVAILVAVTACTSSSSGGIEPGPTFSPNPKRSELVQRADLDPCPRSSTAVAADGLPDVTLPCLGAGPVVHLAGLGGRPTVLNVWGSWCGPCQKETPYFARAYDALKSRVQFLGVDDEDDPDSALDFAAHVSPRMRYPSVIDENKQVLLGLHGFVGVPSTIFVGADGKVVKQVSSAYASTAQLQADIARYLGVQG